MSPTLTTLFEDAINRALRLDPDTLARLAEIEGKAIRLRTAGDPPFEIFVLPDASGLRLRRQHDREPDVTLTGDVPVIFRFALRRFVPEVVAAGEVQISGDIALGQRFQRLLEQADIDWEEQAARVLGDAPAHHLGNALRDLGGWSRQVLRTLQQDLGEFLQEESRLLPVRPRAGAFARSVETLERDLESLEQRLARLRESIR
jgi:ubiquinone biosynthesis protein UbiJ